MSKEFVGTRFKNGVQIGSPEGGIAYLSQLKYYTPVLSPAAVPANTTVERTFTVSGLEVGDTVLSVNKPTAQVGLGIVGFRVSAANTLAITFSNNTGSSITPTASQAYKVVIATLS